MLTFFILFFSFEENLICIKFASQLHGFFGVTGSGILLAAANSKRACRPANREKNSGRRQGAII
jgi:hypothetical protein